MKYFFQILVLCLFIVSSLGNINSLLDVNDVNTITALEASKKTNTIKISLILVVEDQSVLFVRQSLRSLEEIVTTPKTNLEIIIVPVGNRDFENKDALRAVLDSREAFSKFLFLDEGKPNDNIAKAFNRGAKIAKGEFLVFMVDTTEIQSFVTLSSMMKVFESDPEVGVVGAKLLFPDQTIYHAGIELVLQKDVTWTSSDYWASSTRSGDIYEVPGIEHRLQGYINKDKRSMDMKDVTAVSKALMMVRKVDFLKIGGFNTSYSQCFFDVDFCLKIHKTQEKRVVYNPTSVAYYNDKERAEKEYDINDEIAKKDTSLFDKAWGDYVRAQVYASYSVQNMTVIWNMECGTGQVLGFTTEAMNFVRAIHKRIRLKVEVNREDDCKREMKKAGLPLEIRKTFVRLMSRQTSNTENRVSIIHRDPGRYNYFINSDNTLDYIIGRSMYETDRIPSDWPAACNNWKVDKIWVPTEFNRETFSSSGVNISKIDVVPELLDVFHFDSSVHSPFLKEDPKKGFKFLSILKWETRKAWDVLLRAYFDEFRENDKDKVHLYILSRLDDRAKEKYQLFLEEYQSFAGINDTSLLPSVEFLDMLVPFTKLPSVYKSADCFVLPSHGEGWGLPLIEAMSMGLPAIGTNWSGTTGFMNDQNSFLVEVTGMEPAALDGHSWATPDPILLRQHMRTAFENGPETQAKAARARIDVERDFSLDAVGEIAIQKFLEIQPKLLEVRQSKLAQKTIEDNSRRSSTSSTIPPSWYNANPPSWSSSWSSGTSAGQEFVDKDGKKKYKIKIINNK